jgi:carboxyvinyl-carboxyphosphonate phosphorylmutase
MAGTQLIPLEEGVGKMRAALDGRSDPSLVVMGRTGAVSVTGIDDSRSRGRKRMKPPHRCAVLYRQSRTARNWKPFPRDRLPIVLGGAPEEMTARIISQASACGSPCRATRRSPPPTQAVYETLKALREACRPGS